MTMLDMPQVEGQLAGLGFERVHTIPASTYKDNSTIMICPTRGMIHHKVVASWQGLMAPMNQKKMFLFCSGAEVGKAYDQMVLWILNHPELTKWKYIMTVEDDNLLPPDAHIRLLESIEETGYDAMAGLYFTKGDYNMPMAYGDPNEFRATGKLDFRPRNVVEALNAGKIMEVNGVAMGCTLYRLDLFKYIPPPWFVTVQEVENGANKGYTQDLWFCERAKRMGKKFGVDMRVKVGHLDPTTEVVY